MKSLFHKFVWTLSLLILPIELLVAQNQTPTLSPVLPGSLLPFTLEIGQASFSLPAGLQSYAAGTYKGKWVLITGRTNGMHDFSKVGNNFPPSFQNTTVYVIDPATGTSMSRSLTEQSSGLSQHEIDTLSVTASQFFQKGNTLYIVGGYGINTANGKMETKSTLTAIHLRNLVQWVADAKPSVKKSMRQTSNPFLKVTGGALFQDNDHDPFLLILGQNFSGFYREGSNGAYTQQIRPFWLYESEKKLAILPKTSKTIYPDYRRRDLNVIPIMRQNKSAYLALAGVFTLDTGVWTVPITIFPDGSSFEADPSAPDTFKQAMNQYNCAAFGLYSSDTEDMYAVLPGGISFGFFSNGVFETDSEFPFINQVTTIKIDKKNHFTQYLNGEYPFIPSTGSNSGNQLLFGTEAVFFPAKEIPLFKNKVIQLDKLPSSPVVIGYIVGGIMSTLPNTSAPSDSTASPYVFTVTLTKRD